MSSHASGVAVMAPPVAVSPSTGPVAFQDPPDELLIASHSASECAVRPPRGVFVAEAPDELVAGGAVPGRVALGCGRGPVVFAGLLCPGV